MLVKMDFRVHILVKKAWLLKIEEELFFTINVVLTRIKFLNILFSFLLKIGQYCWNLTSIKTPLVLRRISFLILRSQTMLFEGISISCTTNKQTIKPCSLRDILGFYGLIITLISSQVFLILFSDIVLTLNVKSSMAS